MVSQLLTCMLFCWWQQWCAMPHTPYQWDITITATEQPNSCSVIGGIRVLWYWCNCYKYLVISVCQFQHMYFWGALEGSVLFPCIVLGSVLGFFLQLEATTTPLNAHEAIHCVFLIANYSGERGIDYIPMLIYSTFYFER